jgi:hypothetical protein
VGLQLTLDSSRWWPTSRLCAACYNWAQVLRVAGAGIQPLGAGALALQLPPDPRTAANFGQYMVRAILLLLPPAHAGRVMRCCVTVRSEFLAWRVVAMAASLAQLGMLPGCCQTDAAERGALICMKPLLPAATQQPPPSTLAAIPRGAGPWPLRACRAAAPRHATGVCAGSGGPAGDCLELGWRCVLHTWLLRVHDCGAGRAVQSAWRHCRPWFLLQSVHLKDPSSGCCSCSCYCCCCCCWQCSKQTGPARALGGARCITSCLPSCLPAFLACQEPQAGAWQHIHQRPAGPEAALAAAPPPPPTCRACS